MLIGVKSKDDFDVCKLADKAIIVNQKWIWKVMGAS